MLIEKSFEHCGLHCEVRIMPVGCRCGYVFIEKGHPLYGVRYESLPKEAHALVNGGITYSEQEDDSWVLGFDYMHIWDIPDAKCREHKTHFPSIEEYCSLKAFEQIESLHYWDIEPRIATIEIAVDDCKKLAEYLYASKGKPYKKEAIERGLLNGRR